MEEVLEISENTPYQSVLIMGGEQQACIKGETLFHIENGQLTFLFFIVDEEPLKAGLEAFAASWDTAPPLELRIPGRDFVYPARINNFPTGVSTDKRRKIGGYITTSTYGASSRTSDVVNIWLRGIPTGWRGSKSWTHYEGISREQIRHEDNGEAILPASSSLGLTALGGFTLRAGSWTTTLREIPIKDRTDVEVGHICTITKEGGAMTSESVKAFTDENLFPYLSFVFGKRIRYDQIMGGAWAIVPRQRKNIPMTLNHNWFLKSWHNVDLSSPFQAYFNLAPEVKTHWRKVIDHYAASEEIMGTLGEAAIAASVSFSSLEALTRSFISTYACRNQWLKKDLRLKNGKGIIQAVEMVAQKEFSTQGTVVEQASRAVYNVRNQTMHLDLKDDEDAQNAYHRWNSSQALIEILMLAKMGLTKITNRTSLGTFEVMGQDMYKDIRKEELVLGSTESQPEAGKPE